jgi:hypothetical protein
MANISNDALTRIKTAMTSILEELADGERIVMKELIGKVVEQTGVLVSMATGVVPMLAHDWAESGNGSVDRGRLGGVYKGQRPEKTDPRPRCESCNQVVRAKITATGQDTISNEQIDIENQ